MFVRQVQNQFRVSKADVQMFYQNGTWNKPVGVSQIYMMLIGGGGVADGGGFSGNSGNVTTWFGAAQNVPDSLIVSPAIAVTTSSTIGNSTTVSYRGSSLNTLLTATGGNFLQNANTADAAGTFANSGFYQNVLGQTGTNTTPTASTTTFLSVAGAGNITANYGYSATNTRPGYFLLQPVIVACATATASNNVAIGCGSYFNGTTAGAGFVLIASW